jgi:hypothetical protein
MLRIPGSRPRGCRHLTRRDLIQAGGSTLLGLGLADLIADDAAAAPMAATSAIGQGPQFGQAKNVILLYLYGAMSQIDTLDPKPHSPSEIRGPFASISTALPDVRLGEHLSGIAQRLDRMTVVRSMTHPVPIHNVANAVTGIARTDVAMELNAYDARHWPFFGSVLQYLDHEEVAASRGQRRPSLIPTNVILPWRQSAHAPENRAGMYGGFLGSRFDPAVIEFPDKGISSNSLVEKNPYGAAL